MSRNKHPYKRRHYFIKKEFQFKFILKFFILILCGVLISSGLLFLFTRGTLTSSFQHSRLVVTNTTSAILPAVIYTNLITLGLITLASIAVILFISHKIAGPLFRFEKELKKIGEGDLTKSIKLRKNDQITDMADSLNQMVASLHEKILFIQTEVENILESASKQDVTRDFIEELKRLQQKIGDKFKM